MFRISRRLDYGLQMMIALAAEPNDRPLPTALLAEKLEIPLPFMHQIGHTLMQSGLVKASPGPHGGLRLNRSPEEISILQIAEILEGPICVNTCMDCGESCPRQGSCPAQFIWGDLQDRITNYLASVRLDQLVQNAQELPYFNFLNRTPVTDENVS